MISLNKNEITAKLPSMNDVMDMMKQSYIDYSNNDFEIPPVGHMPLPNGELHIKYGIGKKQHYAAIKIASGSYTNYKIGLPNSYGCIMLINSETGFPEYLLNDEGILTDHRTAAAGGTLAKEIVGNIPEVSFGIIGCGIQGYYQAIYTCNALSIEHIFVYDISEDNIKTLQNKLAEHNITISRCDSVESLCKQCDVITTVTPAKAGYIKYEWLKANAHINAFGCDTKGKQELDESVIKNAEFILADSLIQCSTQGELQYLYNDKNHPEIKRKTIEFGTYLNNPNRYQKNGVTVADFTGIASQDIVIANAVI